MDGEPLHGRASRPAACAGAWPTTGVGYRLPTRNTRDPAIVATSKRIRNGIFESHLPLVMEALGPRMRVVHDRRVGKPRHGSGRETRRRGNARHAAARDDCCGCEGGPAPLPAPYGLGRAVARGKARILGRSLLPARRRTDGRPWFSWRRWQLGYAALLALISGVGLVLTQLLLPIGGFAAWEESINRWLADHRDPSLEHLSWIGSTLAGGVVIPVVVGALLVAFVAFRRWRLAAFVLFVICIESGAYRATTLIVHRDRPEVDRLESLPVDASYPSGHTAAALALYGGLLLVLASRRASHQSSPSQHARLLVAIPLFVAWARMYRGMHHLTDSARRPAPGRGRARGDRVRRARRGRRCGSTRRSCLHRRESSAGMTQGRSDRPCRQDDRWRARGAPRDPLPRRCGRSHLVGGAEESLGAQACPCSAEGRSRA